MDLVDEYKSDNENWFYLDLPLVLAAVCRRWRVVALDMPLLWTFVQVDLRRYAGGGTEYFRSQLFKQWISRSKGMQLHLCIEGFDQRESYFPHTFPLSEIDLDRVTYFSLAHRDDVCWKLCWFLTLEAVVEASVVGKYDSGFILGIRMPQLRTLRHLASNLRNFILAHPKIQVLTMDCSSFNNLMPELRSRGVQAFERLTLLRAPERFPVSIMQGIIVNDLVLDGSSVTTWHIVKAYIRLTSHLHIRRAFNGHFWTLFISTGREMGARITQLRLTDVAWDQVSWSSVLIHLPLLATLWIDHDSSVVTMGADYRPLPWGSPTGLLSALPKVYKTLGSLSKITIRCTTPLSTDGLVEFIKLSNRKIDITVSPECFITGEQHRLQQISLVNIVVFSTRFTEGITKRKLVYTV